MFFVFLVDLSKATLRCYTSICDGIIICRAGGEYLGLQQSDQMQDWQDIVSHAHKMLEDWIAHKFWLIQIWIMQLCISKEI